MTAKQNAPKNRADRVSLASKREDIEFLGYDLGHGESAIGRAYSCSMREPEILEYRGQKSLVTAVIRTKTGGKPADIRIGAEAVNMSGVMTPDQSANLWIKFKARTLDDAEVLTPIRLFTQTLIEGLSQDKKIRGHGDSQFIIGCPSGWSLEDRVQYRQLFENAGLASVRIVPESRAALMTALEQGYLSLEAARSSVLIVDIGSSTTDFTYCHDLEADDVGHNILGSGLLDAEILQLNLARQSQRAAIETLIAAYPHYRRILEYWCRQAKEQFFNGSETPVEIIKRLPINGGILFEIRLDKADAAEILARPLVALNGFSWPDAFDFALRETVAELGGRAPETVLLTGGASRLPLIAPACEKAFPGAAIVQGAEPEFAIARGLAWLGRFESLHARFKSEVAALLSVGGPVYEKAKAASRTLGERLAPVLVDNLTEHCVLPAFRQWRSGQISRLDDVEAELTRQVKLWLSSEQAQLALRPVIDNWFTSLQRDIEKDTDPLCREHGFPAMVLSLDDSQPVSQYLDGMSMAAPQIGSLETDTALIGTTLSAIILGALLAKANLLAPLLANPIGIVVGSALAGGGFIFGRKALEGRFRRADVPAALRQVMTDGRIRRAAEKQRADMVRAVNEAWQDAASERFTTELIDTLRRALAERADERAVLFLI